MPIRVCIVEDDEMIRNSFSDLISNSMECELSGAYETSEAFIANCKIQKPDVVLMDIQLPGRSGIECVRQMKQEFPHIQFLMCTVFEDGDNIFDALCAGATGYMLKTKDTAKLIQYIVEINSGESPMSGIIARKVVSGFHKRKNPNEYLELLSKREREILDYLARGFRYKEIAERVFLSVETVRTHIRNIYQKLQADSRTDALNKVFPK